MDTKKLKALIMDDKKLKALHTLWSASRGESTKVLHSILTAQLLTPEDSKLVAVVVGGSNGPTVVDTEWCEKHGLSHLRILFSHGAKGYEWTVTIVGGVFPVLAKELNAQIRHEVDAALTGLMPAKVVKPKKSKPESDQ